jgi:hypothetical protein
VKVTRTGRDRVIVTANVHDDGSVVHVRYSSSSQSHREWAGKKEERNEGAAVVVDTKIVSTSSVPSLVLSHRSAMQARGRSSSLCIITCTPSYILAWKSIKDRN